MGLKKVKNLFGCCELKMGMTLMGLILCLIEVTQTLFGIITLSIRIASKLSGAFFIVTGVIKFAADVLLVRKDDTYFGVSPLGPKWRIFSKSGHTGPV